MMAKIAAPMHHLKRVILPLLDAAAPHHHLKITRSFITVSFLAFILHWDMLAFTTLIDLHTCYHHWVYEGTTLNWLKEFRALSISLLFKSRKHTSGITLITTSTSRSHHSGKNTSFILSRGKNTSQITLETWLRKTHRALQSLHHFFIFNHHVW